MKVGDLVRHRFDGARNEVGLVTATKKSPTSSLGIASVLWCNSPHIRDYRFRDLESVR